MNIDFNEISNKNKNKTFKNIFDLNTFDKICYDIFLKSKNYHEINAYIYAVLKEICFHFNIFQISYFSLKKRKELLCEVIYNSLNKKVNKKKLNFSIIDLGWSIFNEKHAKFIFFDNISKISNENLKKVLSLQQINSLLIVPLYKNNIIYGILRFEQNELKGQFSKEIIFYLRTLSHIINVNLFYKINNIKLFEKEKMFENISATSAIILINNKNKIIYWNQASQEIFGYSSKEVIKKDFIDLIASDEEKEKLTENLQQIKKNKNYISNKQNLILEMNVFTKNSTLIPVEFSISRLKMRNVTYTINVIRDITKRKNAEKKLKESEELYRNTFDTVPNSVTITKVIDGTYMLVNKFFCEKSGFSREEAIGKNPNELNMFVNPQHRDEFISVLKKDGQVNEFELQYRMKNGDVYETALSARPLIYKGEKCLVAVVQDITIRKRAEQKIRQSEEKYRLLFEYANEAIFVTQNGNIDFLNPKTKELLGIYQEQNNKKINFFDFIHSDYQNFIKDKYNEILSSKKPFGPFSFNIINNLGQNLWVELNMVMVNWERKKSVLNFLRDITEKKKLEEHFQHARKMESIGTLAGGIAHDFNNLLMGILGNITIALSEINNKEDNNMLCERLSNVEHYVQNGADLTRRLLGFARRGKYEVKIVNVNELIKKSAEMFGRTRKEISIFFNFEKDLGLVEIDQNQIENVLLNIYVNAWQSMKEGGKLFINTCNVYLKNDLKEIKEEIIEGDYILIGIKDTGEGMDKKTQERIFEPFFTTKERGLGTGLGLASVYGIIKNHNGIINVFSEKNKGTLFNIYLPKTYKKNEIKNVFHKKIFIGTETILLVDDEKMILDTAKVFLEKLGYKVLTAYGGKEALEIFQNNKEIIDMVILDIIMPEIKGDLVYKKIKKINPNIKVLFSSGYGLERQIQKNLNSYYDGFIQKPYNIEQLSKKVREILNAKRERSSDKV